MMNKWIALLLALALLLTACGGKGEAPAAQTDAPAADTAGGQVYYLNIRPEADGVLRRLAADYTAQTGTRVTVVTVPSSAYGDALAAQMTGSEPPTIYHVANLSELKDWADYALDLSDTPLAGESTCRDLNLYGESGQLLALGCWVETFGILVNTSLLEREGHTLDEITDFPSLKAVADDIHLNAPILGFDAFAPAGLHSSSAWRFSRQLTDRPLFCEFRDRGEAGQPAAITGDYLRHYRSIWDLYITDSAVAAGSLGTITLEESRAHFAGGEAVFYQCDSWERSFLEESMPELSMIPIYCGIAGEENMGLSTGAGSYWVVNAQASPADQKASQDFLCWLVTESVSELSGVLGEMPFRSAPGGSAGEDGGQLGFAFHQIPNADAWSATVVTALTVYAADPTDANWEKVEQAFVDGWAYEYTMENG